MKINKQEFKEAIRVQLKDHFGKTFEEANKKEVFYAVSYAARGYILDNWIATKKTYEEQDVKQAYYLSAEFLMGRALSNNLVNLTIENDVKEVLEEIGFDYNAVEDTEPDAGLGNGGLGRLAACFLDSLATLQLPGNGYGIRYKYGMFEQKIVDGYQFEIADEWLKNEDPFAVRRDDEAVEVNFGGHIAVERDSNGVERFKLVDADIVRAIPFDTPVVAYGSKTVNTLRLWEAHSTEEFELQYFNDGHYLKSVEKANDAEDISRVLYPNDNVNPGKALRLRQQYFFVSASLQDVVAKYKKKHGNDFSKFNEKVSFQLNDTHPVVAIPELMRILMDDVGMGWDEAWGIVTKTCAYTNHTILSEALEKWPVSLFNLLIPRVYQIIEEINRRFVEELKVKYSGDWAKISRMSIIEHGMIRMAWLAIVGGFSVNGVAALHTEILKNQELKDWYELYPNKFNNKTNGVTQRRWLLKSNQALSNLITEKIGDGWIKNLAEIKKFQNFIDDSSVVNKIQEIKYNNKVKLAKYIKEHNGVDIDPDSIFDVQVKRLHEYKRQLLNVLHIMYLYNQIKANPNIDLYPRTFIFGAKAASGYRRAKLVIKLINNIANKVNNDSDVNKKLKVVFLENYRVSLAEKVFPASDVSEQISTAGKEASGTGNMKFMMNGALTIGTLDGANVEIVEEAGELNAFIFGLKDDEVETLTRNNAYNPWDEYTSNAGLAKVIDQLIDGTYSPDRKEIFKEIYDSLMYGVEGNRADQYFVLKDFADYAKAQANVDKEYRDKYTWAKKAIMNIANSGKFSSDRTINEYANDIWNIKPVDVK